jgi:hypothetical protein
VPSQEAIVQVVVVEKLKGAASQNRQHCVDRHGASQDRAGGCGTQAGQGTGKRIARSRLDSNTVRGGDEGLRIRAIGQANAQETIGKPLTPDYLRFTLDDRKNSKLVLLSDNVPILINPGSNTHRLLNQDALEPGERSLFSC